VRKAILLELHQACGVDLPPPVDKLQVLARALVAKAEAAHDLRPSGFDRIGGRTPFPLGDPERLGSTKKQDFARTFQVPPLTDGVAS
jgi:hypothetical protein